MSQNYKDTVRYKVLRRIQDIRRRTGRKPPYLAVTPHDYEQLMLEVEPKSTTCTPISGQDFILIHGVEVFDDPHLATF